LDRSNDGIKFEPAEMIGMYMYSIWETSAFDNRYPRFTHALRTSMGSRFLKLKRKRIYTSSHREGQEIRIPLYFTLYRSKTRTFSSKSSRDETRLSCSNQDLSDLSFTDLVSIISSHNNRLFRLQVTRSDFNTKRHALNRDGDKQR